MIGLCSLYIHSPRAVIFYEHIYELSIFDNSLRIIFNGFSYTYYSVVFLFTAARIYFRVHFLLHHYRFRADERLY